MIPRCRWQVSLFALSHHTASISSWSAGNSIVQPTRTQLAKSLRMHHHSVHEEQAVISCHIFIQWCSQSVTQLPLTIWLQKHIATAVVIDVDGCFTLNDEIPHRARLGLKERFDAMVASRTGVAGRTLSSPVNVPVAVWICAVAILAAPWRDELAGCVRLEVGSVA